MRITENLLVITCLSLLILVLLLQTSDANQIMNPYNCSPSACGTIRNISFPFRLKHDPKHCGDPSYELACENNFTTIYLNSQKFHVKAINYHNFTIRLAHVSINNNTCSFPKYSVYGYNFSDDYPYSTKSLDYLISVASDHDVAWPINFMTCPYPLKNSSLLTEANVCSNGDNFFDSSNGRHTYIMVGRMNASDVRDMCRVGRVVMTSWRFKDFKNVSVLEIHDSLLYGFELSWFGYPCSKCKSGRDCNYDIPSEKFWCGGDVCLIYFTMLNFRCDHIKWLFHGLNGTILILLLIIGVNLAARIIIGFPCVMVLLIYKFRRRHLSMFDVIEGFLQSDNKLMPIRYSYSDIRKMTKGFREKLGQGGFGSVYKGKLRSGHDVAVKLLGKAGANGKDFMNEIGTIGRIHHVNVVKLVGYCAERSKRALVFDFMPNGSLEKYIFSREKENTLEWDRKYEIAVGVARGIEYLHRGCDIQILHFDIKPHNILLDDKFIPKISDFGLAKFCSTEKNTVTLTAVRGTIGCVAPELINRGIGRVSYKADIYSFGMLLMEMVGLNRDLIRNNETSSKYFPYWIYDCFDQGQDIEIGKADDENCDDATRKIARKMTIVALWCIQMSPDARPSMNKVVEMLEGEVERLQIPPRPSHSTQVAVNEDESWSAYSTDSVSLLCHDATPSVEITIEDL